MAEHDRELNSADPQYEETVHPENPPQSMVRRRSRSTWLTSSLGTLVAIFLVFAAGFLIITARRSLEPTPQVTPNPKEVGTSGERQPREGTPGGFNPTPAPDSTIDELKFRGDDLVGERVELRDVKVERVDGDVFWVRDGDTTMAVVAAGGTPTVKAGQFVNVSGTKQKEAGGSEARIRASRIEVR